MFQVGQFLQHAHFLQNHPAERLQNRFDGMSGLVSKKRSQDSQKQVEQKDVYANLELDVFAQKFDGNDFSGLFQLGFVDLADGSAGDGL